MPTGTLVMPLTCRSDYSGPLNCPLPFVGATAGRLRAPGAYRAPRIDARTMLEAARMPGIQIMDVPLEQQPRTRGIAVLLSPLAFAVAIWLVSFSSSEDRSLPRLSGFLIVLAIVAACVTLVAGIRLRRASSKGWLLLPGTCLASGYAYFSGSPGDFFSNLSFLLMVGSAAGAALLLCGIGQEWRDQTRLALDLLPPIIALSVASWVFVVGPYILDGGESLATKAAVVIHGLGGLVLVTLSAAGLLSNRKHALSRSSHLLLVGLSALAIADAFWMQRLTSWPPASEYLPGLAFGLALTIFGVAGMYALTGVGTVQHEPATTNLARPTRWGSQVKNAALGGLLVLAGGQSLFGEPVAFGAALSIGGALSLLVFVIGRESVVSHRERQLHQEIGNLSEKIDGLISQVGRDPLTGLLNHRAVHERLDHELANGRASGEAVAVILVDVDNFKTVNDTLGHQAGDRVLHAVASIMTAACRGTDVAARYAGDEFMLVLPGLNEQHAGNVGARIAEEVRRVDKDLNLGHGISVSLSIGVAVTHRCQRSMAQTVAIADAAMYDAKEGGKNRVVVVNADTLVITEPHKVEQTVDEIMAASLSSPSWQAPNRRQTG